LRYMDIVSLDLSVISIKSSCRRIQLPMFYGQFKGLSVFKFKKNRFQWLGLKNGGVCFEVAGVLVRKLIRLTPLSSAKRANPRYFIRFCGINYELASCVHRPIVYSESTIAGHTARIPSPLPLHVAKTGRNHLNEEFTPLLPTGIGKRF
jgi:hypothetical protein